jgi:hypothetical protein
LTFRIKFDILKESTVLEVSQMPFFDLDSFITDVEEVVKRDRTEPEIPYTDEIQEIEEEFDLEEFFPHDPIDDEF